MSRVSGPNTGMPMALVDWSSRLAQLGQQAQNPHLQGFYQAGCVEPQTPISEVPLVALDFETTGLDPAHDDIVSIGLVPFNLSRIFMRQAQHWLVNPQQPLGEDSVVIHGITHSDVADAPDLQRILEQVLKALAGSVVVVHYRMIEREFFDSALRYRINEGIEFPVIDTMALEGMLLKRQQPWWQQLLQRQVQDSVRLGDARHRYGLPFYHVHHALTDALATAELLQAQIAHHFSPDTRVGDLWN